MPLMPRLILIFIFGVLVSYAVSFLLPQKPSASKWCIRVTDKGRAYNPNRENPIFKHLLDDLAYATGRNQNKNRNITDCTFDELLTAIKKTTPSGGEYLDAQVLSGLVRRGYLSVRHHDATRLKQQLEQLKSFSDDTQKEKRKQSP